MLTSIADAGRILDRGIFLQNLIMIKRMRNTISAPTINPHSRANTVNPHSVMS